MFSTPLQTLQKNIPIVLQVHLTLLFLQNYNSNIDTTIIRRIEVDNSFQNLVVSVILLIGFELGVKFCVTDNTIFVTEITL